MRNGDYIRGMDNDRLARLLVIWTVNSVCSFLEKGGLEILDAKQLREWMEKEDFSCRQTMVGDDFVFDSDFNLKDSTGF